MCTLCLSNFKSGSQICHICNYKLTKRVITLTVHAQSLTFCLQIFLLFFTIKPRDKYSFSLALKFYLIFYKNIIKTKVVHKNNLHYIISVLPIKRRHKLFVRVPGTLLLLIVGYQKLLPKVKCS